MKDLQQVNVANVDSKPITKMFFSWLLNKGQDRISLNPCHSTGVFLNSLKTSQKQRFSTIFRGKERKKETNDME